MNSSLNFKGNIKDYSFSFFYVGGMMFQDFSFKQLCLPKDNSVLEPKKKEKQIDQ